MVTLVLHLNKPCIPMRLQWDFALYIACIHYWLHGTQAVNVHVGVWPASSVEPATFRSLVRLSTDWATATALFLSSIQHNLERQTDPYTLFNNLCYLYSPLAFLNLMHMVC